MHHFGDPNFTKIDKEFSILSQKSFCGHPSSLGTIQIYSHKFPGGHGRPQECISVSENLPEGVQKTTKNQTKLRFCGNFGPI